MALCRDTSVAFVCFPHILHSLVGEGGMMGEVVVGTVVVTAVVHDEREEELEATS